ncbi:MULTISPECIES: signal peptidase II [unclassified Geodermatophilus]|uniref:signal peptidase II n=1 Tax=unclassified Geodermatophilus TaxID=2637632 RepID=UPI003EE8BBC3
MRRITAAPDARPAARCGGARRGRGYRREARQPAAGATTEEPVLSERSEPEDGGDRATGPADDARRRPRTRLLLLLATAVLLADLGTKLLVVATIDAGENIRLLGGAVYLTHARNTGAAFSFAEGFTVVFTLIAVAVAVVIVRTARRLFSTAWAVALGLVLGGAVGNLVDRVFREPGFLRGGVVDFVSVFAPDGQVYPIFNVADSAIVCGGILGVLLALRGIEFDGSRTSGDRAARDGGPAHP